MEKNSIIKQLVKERIQGYRKDIWLSLFLKKK